MRNACRIFGADDNAANADEKLNQSTEHAKQQDCMIARQVGGEWEIEMRWGAQQHSLGVSHPYVGSLLKFKMLSNFAGEFITSGVSKVCMSSA